MSISAVREASVITTAEGELSPGMTIDEFVVLEPTEATISLFWAYFPNFSVTLIFTGIVLSEYILLGKN